MAFFRQRTDSKTSDLPPHSSTPCLVGMGSWRYFQKQRGIFLFFFEIKKKPFHIFVSFKWLLKERERRKTFFLSTCIHLFNLSLFFKVRISPSKKVESPLKIMKNACFFILKALFVLKICNPLSANFTKWSNTLKQFVAN